MLGFGAIGQFAIGEVSIPTAEVIQADKWFVSLSEPVRVKPAVRAGSQPYFTFFPNPLVSFGWYGRLTEPVRVKPRNPAALAPYVFYQPAPSPFVASGWYEWLSEPVRIKPGLRAHLQRADTQSTVFVTPPNTFLNGWFNWMSEPKRFRAGLGAPYQISYRGPDRLLPPANITATMRAGYVNADTGLFAVNVVKYNPPVSASVSIVEIGNGLSPTSVIESS